MERYLVTGAAGFIGSALARRLVQAGNQVVIIDNLSTGYRQNVPAEAQFFETDCQDPSLYERLPKGYYEAIFHIAGQSSGEISFDNPVYDLRTNTESTLLLLKFAHKVECKRLIYASTMSVYGSKSDAPVSENEIPMPESFYGVGKLASEHYLRVYERFGIRSTALRLFNVYGPGQNLANLRQGMISIYLAQMLQLEAIHVKGSGDRYRDHIYIDDVVEAFLLCLKRPESCGLDLNIGTGVRTTVTELIEMMIAIHNRPVGVKYEGSTPGDVHGIYADPALAERILGFKARHSLAQGLRKMYDWAINQKSHPD